MTALPATEAECRAAIAAIQAHYRQPDTQTAATLAALGVTRLAGGANNAVFLCQYGGRTCCVKVYRTDGRERDEREWLALHLLKERCPDLTPRPLWREADSLLPMVALEYLPGHPLRDRPIGQRELTALAEALNQLRAITPQDATFPYRSTGASEQLHARVAAWLAADGNFSSETNASLREIRALARERLFAADAMLTPDTGLSIFGRGDPNLANCLWDAGDGRVRLIDFEYAGWSDIAGELADLIEGPWARHVADDTWLTFAHALGICDDASQRRFAAARRVCATFWVMKFAEQVAHDPTEARHFTLARQLTRARQLLQERG